MKASLRSVRIAPKKAQLVAKMIRGKSVPDAVYILERTNKKAARLLEQLLRSAMANASHNDSQDAQMLIIKTLIVNKAQAYHRGIPMARGRVRPIRKFLSHIDLTLGLADMEDETEKKTAKDTSKEAKKPVKKVTTTKTTTSTKGKSSTKKDTTTSSSKSVASKKSVSTSSSTKK